jgi:hypothetical protein
MGDAHAQHIAWHQAQDQELLALRQQVLALHTEVRSLEDELRRAQVLRSAAYGGWRRDPRPWAAAPSVDASGHGDPGEGLGG